MSNDKKSLTFYSDPGHGWLAVPMADVLASGADISPYSYMSPGGRVAYLEEDCDVGRFIEALGGRAVFDARYNINRHSYAESSHVRRQPTFRADTRPRLDRAV